MMKKVLCGALAVALAAGTVAVAPAADASAASVPKAKYTFNMNKANKNVVAVARKGDTNSLTTGNTDTGVLPTTAAAKSKKAKLSYKKGKKGKALYLSRMVGKKPASFGAEVKGVKLGSKSWTVSFWVKPENELSQFMSVFFTGSNIVNKKKCKWISITKAGSDWGFGDLAPVVWSHNAALDKADDDQHFPWYGFQNEEGTWQGTNDNPKAKGLSAGKWTYVTLVVDAKDTCEYGTKGEKGYVKSYHAWTYINGALFGNGTVAKNSMSNSNKFFLGINAWDTPFKGMIDELQFWNKALKAKQVKALYKKMK